MFNEFPKMLYRGENTTIVADTDTETIMRSQGWYAFGEDPKADPESKPKGKAKADPEGK